VKKAILFLPLTGFWVWLLSLGISAAVQINLSVRLTSPNGGEIWKAGDKKEITWIGAGSAEVAGVTISYSTDFGATTKLVASLQGNTTSFLWDVPPLASESCLIIVEVFGVKGGRARDQSDSTFTIMESEPRPDLAVEIESSKKVAYIESFLITVTVKNTGTALSPASLCEVAVRNAHSPRQLLRRIAKKIRELSAGGSYSFSLPLKVGVGLFEICATVDPKKKIAEQDEANNRFCIEVAGR